MTSVISECTGCEHSSESFGSLDALPSEVLLLCFSFMNHTEIMNKLFTVSKGLLSIIARGETLWEGVLKNEFRVEGLLYPYRKKVSMLEKFIQYLLSLKRPRNIEREEIRIEGDEKPHLFELVDDCYGHCLLLNNEVVGSFCYPTSWDGSLLRLCQYGKFNDQSEFESEVSNLRMILNNSAIDDRVPLSLQFERILNLFKPGEYTIEYRAISPELAERKDVKQCYFRDGVGFSLKKYRDIIPPSQKNVQTIYDCRDLLKDSRSVNDIIFFGTQDFDDSKDPRRIEHYENMIRTENRFPILLLAKLKGSYYILDGHHKFAAYQKVKKYPLRAVIIELKRSKRRIIDVVGRQNMMISQYLFYCLEYVDYDCVWNSESVSLKEKEILEKLDPSKKLLERYARDRNMYVRSYLERIDVMRKYNGDVRKLDVHQKEEEEGEVEGEKSEEDKVLENALFVIEKDRSMTVREFTTKFMNEVHQKVSMKLEKEIKEVEERRKEEMKEFEQYKKEEKEKDKKERLERGEEEEEEEVLEEEEKEKEEEGEIDYKYEFPVNYQVRYKNCLMIQNPLSFIIYCPYMIERYREFTHLGEFDDEKNMEKSFVELCFEASGFYPEKDQKFVYVLIRMELQSKVVVKFVLSK